MKILLIEDDLDLQHTISEFLIHEQMLVEVASTCTQAIDKLISFPYDCVILDMMLPDGSGMDVLKEIKHLNIDTAVVILSAKNSVEDKVEGLMVGADDYLAKPFHFAELLARVKVAIRKKYPQSTNELSFKNIIIYINDHIVKVNGSDVKLNRKEYDLLYYFMLRPNKVLQKATLAESVWGDHVEFSDNLDFIYSQVKNLKKKLKEAQAEADIQAVYGVGYKLQEL